MPSDFLYHAYLDQKGQPAVAPGPLLQHEEALAVFFSMKLIVPDRRHILCCYV